MKPLNEISDFKKSFKGNQTGLFKAVIILGSHDSINNILKVNVVVDMAKTGIFLKKKRPAYLHTKQDTILMFTPKSVYKYYIQDVVQSTLTDAVH